VTVKRQYDVYVGNLLVANGQRSLVWCFDPSQAMVLRDDDVVEPYGGKCPSGVIGFIPAILVRTPGPHLTPSPAAPSSVPLPLASLAPGRVWRLHVYRPVAPPTP